MPLQKFQRPTNIIAELPDRPVTDGGYTVPQFKAKFDENSQNLKDFLNDTLTDELDAILANMVACSNTSGKNIFLVTSEPQNGDSDGIYLVYEE